jgi:hypothetical protein
MAEIPDRGPATNPDEGALGSPSGPHPKGVDEAAGGADSSPLEDEPSGTRSDLADEEQAATPGDDRSPCQAPPGWWQP